MDQRRVSHGSDRGTPTRPRGVRTAGTHGSHALTPKVAGVLRLRIRATDRGPQLPPLSFVQRSSLLVGGSRQIKRVACCNVRCVGLFFSYHDCVAAKTGPSISFCTQSVSRCVQLLSNNISAAQQVPEFLLRSLLSGLDDDPVRPRGLWLGTSGCDGPSGSGAGPAYGSGDNTKPNSYANQGKTRWFSVGAN